MAATSATVSAARRRENFILRYRGNAMLGTGNNLEHEELSPEAVDAANNARSLGAILRFAREQREMTIREVAAQIRIPAWYLTMLEANDYGAMADELYLLPFLRNYADFLGLEAGALSARFLRSIQPLERVADLEPEVAVERETRRSAGEEKKSQDA